MNKKIERVHVVYKTHLDIGFTDASQAVVNRYLSCYIPQALTLAEQTRELKGQGRFIWTVGSWLIYTALERLHGEARKRLENAILKGDICWHGLPFTTHTEYMDSSLFKYGLSLSQSLDKRFGRKTIAAKMTDVPGHTCAIIPLLADAGIEFLHIGVNPASMVPDVPRLCRWRYGGKEVLLCYEGDYGMETAVPEAGAALVFGFTGDNNGPQTEEEFQENFDLLTKKHQPAKVFSSTLNDFARELLPLKDTLPLVENEIGDTWIHGVGGDPEKTRRFRALLRWRNQLIAQNSSWAGNADIRDFSRILLLVAEHTWGRDTKSNQHFADEKFHRELSKKHFLENRQNGLYADLEKSWSEQRCYIDQAIDCLSGSPLHEQAARSALWPTEPDYEWLQVKGNQDITLKNAFGEIKIDQSSGTIYHFCLAGQKEQLAGKRNPLGQLRYEVFGSKQYERFEKQYNLRYEETKNWAIPDFCKPGLAHHILDGKSWTPVLQKTYLSHDELALKLQMTFPSEASNRYGAPRELSMIIMLQENGVEFDLRWKRKDACRFPEAIWFGFHPRIKNNAEMHLFKMGQPIDPRNVIKGGNRNLHVCERVEWSDNTKKWVLDLPDTGLCAPGGGKLVDFSNKLPILRNGIEVNLWNNTWGTNFPMYYDNDAVFRFRYLCH